MLLIIHNLPPYITLAGVKSLIKGQCNITELILDNLKTEGPTKRVTVGLADENDAAVLISKLSGMFMNGHHLFVEDIRQKKMSKQSYNPVNSSQIPEPRPQHPLTQVSVNMPNMPNKQMPALMPTPYNNMPFYMSSQNNVAYNTPATLLNPAQPVGFFPRPAVLECKTNENPWKDQAISYPNYGQTHNTKELQRYEGETRQYIPTQQESNWREEGGERSSQRKDLYMRRDHESFRESSRGSERDKEQKSFRQTEKMPSYRSDNRRDDNYSKRSRYSRVERSPPRDRRDNRSSNRRRSDERRRSPNRRGRSHERDESRNKNFDYRRQNCDNGRNNQNLSQKRDFGSKRPYSADTENSFTQSNNSNNTFTRTNASLISQKPGHMPSNFDTNYGGPPEKILRKVEHKPFSSIKSDANMSAQTQSAQFCAHSDLPLKEKLEKQNIWIENAGAELASMMVKSTNKQWIPMYCDFMKKLKTCIISRVEVILGDSIVSSYRDIEMAYRSRFSVSDDPRFVKGVLEKHKRDLRESNQQQGNYDEEHKEINRDSPTGGNTASVGENMNNRVRRRFKKRALRHNPNISQQQHETQTGQIARSDTFRPADNMQLATRMPELSLQKIQDTRLQGDKQVYKDQKKLQKMEYSQEVQYSLEPHLDKALREEMSVLCDEFVATCMETMTNENENIVGVRIKDEAIPEFKKVVELLITKRILNISTGLTLRVFALGKMPKREVVLEALRPYDIVRIKKSDKKRLYLATCANYDTFDTLNRMKLLKVDETTLQIRPLNLTGPRQSVREKRKAASNIPPGNRIPDHEEEILGEESNVEEDDEEDRYDEQDDENDMDDHCKQEHGGFSYEDSEKYPINFDELSESHIDMSAFANDEFEYFEDKENDETLHLNDSDVVLVETKNEVVVIEDNDKTVNEADKNDDGENIAPKGDEENNAITSNANEAGTEKNEGIGSEDIIKINEQMIDDINVGDDDLEDF